MMVVSSGGVVVLGNTVLLLRKLNGDWVLPKGRIEENETAEMAAVREVKEETGVKAEVLDFIGETTYDFRNSWNSVDIISKRVHWYLMLAKTTHLVPQKEEGFVEAKFIHVNRLEEVVRYEDERSIIRRALDQYQAIKR